MMSLDPALSTESASKLFNVSSLPIGSTLFNNLAGTNIISCFLCVVNFQKSITFSSVLLQGQCLLYCFACYFIYNKRLEEYSYFCSFFNMNDEMKYFINNAQYVGIILNFVPCVKFMILMLLHRLLFA